MDLEPFEGIFKDGTILVSQICAFLGIIPKIQVGSLSSAIPTTPQYLIPYIKSLSIYLEWLLLLVQSPN
jgi:hypothetical protein